MCACVCVCVRFVSVCFVCGPMYVCWNVFVDECVCVLCVCECMRVYRVCEMCVRMRVSVSVCVRVMLPFEGHSEGTSESLEQHRWWTLCVYVCLSPCVNVCLGVCTCVC